MIKAARINEIDGNPAALALGKLTLANFRNYEDLYLEPAAAPVFYDTARKPPLR